MPAAVFEANPASCPAASVVGTATVLTPVVRQPLSGPVFVVSHGVRRRQRSRWCSAAKA